MAEACIVIEELERVKIDMTIVSISNDMVPDGSGQFICYGLGDDNNLYVWERGYVTESGEHVAGHWELVYVPENTAHAAYDAWVYRGTHAYQRVRELRADSGGAEQ